jgi:hypothetical protein
MPVWVLEFDNGKGESWEYFFGTRKEAVAYQQSGAYKLGPTYNKGYATRRDYAENKNGSRKEGDYVIWKCLSTGPYVNVLDRMEEMMADAYIVDENARDDD